MPEMSNWDKLKNQDPAHDVRYHNVYEEQQLDRSDKPKMITKGSRIALLVAGLFFAALLIWVFVSLLELISYGARNGGFPPGTTPLAFFGIDLLKIIIEAAVLIPGGIFAYKMLMLNLRAQNVLADDSDINDHTGDQHIAMPQELMERYDFFPDVGAHSSVSPSSMVSHVMLSNKGIDKVDFVHPDMSEDADPDAEFYARIDGDRDMLDIHRDPMFDEKFADDLFTVSGVPKELRKWFDPKKIPYNPGNANRDKLKGYDTYADVINGDWELPLYEVQRPAGAYVVDGAPVNTMVLAITRAGKGQTYIEPMLDMWTREKVPQNILANDPKGELLQKNYVPAVVRGFTPVQFNLINEIKTDIYNPLALAAEAAREGDFTQCASFVENIAEVFFPVDGSDDPVWPNAANNAFKRAAYGMIDYYMEKERELRNEAERTGMASDKLATEIDNLWGRVTLYNCYQLFVQLTARKRKNPEMEYSAIVKKIDAYRKAMNETQDPSKIPANLILTDEEQELCDDNAKLAAYKQKVKFESTTLYNGANDADELSLYFAATNALPINGIRKLVINADNSLKSMGAAEKMLASVYGIAVTAMSFFADPRIQTLTSGTPSQNVDLAGLSFPRRIGVRLHANFFKDYRAGLIGSWSAYADDGFTQNLGPKFSHECVIRKDGWVRYAFEGVFPNDVSYIKLEIKNSMTGLLVKTLWFRFTKTYQKSLDGRYYVTDPVLDQKIVKDGIIEEMRPVPGEDGKFEPGSLTFKTTELNLHKTADGVGHVASKSRIKHPVICATSVHYAEKPKFVFLVTPPHLMKYAKLILILIKQLVDVSFDQSYMTKANQKPLYMTRYMLDELGNLQSEGHGINSFQTMLSIGLGQGQQFTLILQTLQQLRDCYGDNVDRVISGNAQPLNAQVATVNGWKPMGELQLGDKLMSCSGEYSVVQGIYPRGTRPVYRVTRRDGSSCLVCNEHLWAARIKPA